jgi:hypothetical protein
VPELFSWSWLRNDRRLLREDRRRLGAGFLRMLDDL